MIKKVTPHYPSSLGAKKIRLEGVVRLTAVVGKDGSVQDLKVTLGHPLLAASASEAVKQWIYEPTLLKVEPIEVTKEVEINFILSMPSIP